MLQVCAASSSMTPSRPSSAIGPEQPQQPRRVPQVDPLGRGLARRLEVGLGVGQEQELRGQRHQREAHPGDREVDGHGDGEAAATAPIAPPSIVPALHHPWNECRIERP